MDGKSDPREDIFRHAFLKMSSETWSVGLQGYGHKCSPD